ncbi:hypothetical protein MMC18_006037 [Xylographa bjoerkii]|nr:hypothetical protein [Xylographa bjoerkii]
MPRNIILLLFGAVLGSLAYILVYTVYNLFFHPLARFKGPLLWRAFRLPFIATMINGRLPHRVKELHEQYGEVVRVGPDELSFTNPAVWRDVYPKNFVRAPQYKDKVPGKDADSLISASEADHARFRKILAPAFSEKATSLQEPYVKLYVDKLISKLHGEMGMEKGQQASTRETGVVDLMKWFNYAAFDIIGELSWGSSFGCLDEMRLHSWIQVISQFKIAIITCSFKFYYPLSEILTFITPKAALAPLMQMWKTTEEKVQERMSMETTRPDLISHILTSNASSGEDAVAPMSREEIEVNAMAIMAAGSESITTILTGVVNHLLREPSKLQRLVQEVRSSFETEEDITGTSTKGLAYLDAVLREGMRMCPTIPDGMRRAVPEGGASVAGHFLPAGTVVSIPPWATYQSASNFSSPTRFAPERWLAKSVAGAARDGAADEYARDRKDAFKPFSLGPHNCLGQNLAHLELRLILARMLWNFDMQVPEGTGLPEWGCQDIYWFWDKQPMFVKLSEAAVAAAAR